MPVRRWSEAAAAMALLLWGAPLAAQTFCTASAGSIVFGVYDIFSPVARDTNAALTLECRHRGGPVTVNISLAFDAGLHGTSPTNRAMRGSSGDLLSYQLFRDASYTQPWGSGLNALTLSQSFPGSANSTIGFSLTASVFARIPAGQDVAAGLYSDRLVLSVTP